MENFQQIFQGDVWLMKLPDTMKVDLESPIPNNGRLILQEGEMTGHHHYVDSAIMERPADLPPMDADVDFDEVFKDPSLKKMFSSKRKEATAKFYTASKLAEQLVKDQVLVRSDLVVGMLEVTNGPMNLYHQEHGSLPLSPGKYIVGRQIESVAGEERRVAD